MARLRRRSRRHVVARNMRSGTSSQSDRWREPERVACALCASRSSRARGRVVIADISNHCPWGGASRCSRRHRAHLRLVEGVTADDLDRVHDPLMSPPPGDLGHIAAFEDLWVSREAGSELLREDLADVYDAFETPRAGRGELRYLRHDELPATPGRFAIEPGALDDLSPFIAEMLIQHEHQHNETMLQTLQLAEPGVYSPELTPASPAASGGAARRGRLVRAGRRGRGLRLRQRATAPPGRAPRLPDRQRAGHQRAYAEFVADGGYARRELWSEEGWGSARARPGSARSTGQPTAACAASTASSRSSPAARDARLLPRGRGVRALAGRASAERGGVGARRARRGRLARPARAARLRPRSRRAVRGRLLGVDRHRVRRLSRASAPTPTPSTPRSSSAPATGSCAAPPGRRAPASRARPSATGTTPAPADLRRLPLRGGRLMGVVIERHEQRDSLADDVRNGLAHAA